MLPLSGASSTVSRTALILYTQSVRSLRQHGWIVCISFVKLLAFCDISMALEPRTVWICNKLYGYRRLLSWLPSYIAIDTTSCNKLAV